jgi:hypothetical protein
MAAGRADGGPRHRDRVADYSAALKLDPNYGLHRGATDRALSDLSRAIQVAENDPNRLSPLELFYARRSRATIYGDRIQLDAEIADCSAMLLSTPMPPANSQPIMLRSEIFFLIMIVFLLTSIGT